MLSMRLREARRWANWVHDAVIGFARSLEPFSQVRHLCETAQETLLLVYRRIGALRTVTSFSAWMFSIVRHEYGRLWRQMHGQVPAA